MHFLMEHCRKEVAATAAAGGEDANEGGQFLDHASDRFNDKKADLMALAYKHLQNVGSTTYVDQMTRNEHEGQSLDRRRDLAMFTIIAKAIPTRKVATTGSDLTSLLSEVGIAEAQDFIINRDITNALLYDMHELRRGAYPPKVLKVRD